jgi:hypothetical protein
MPILFHSEPRQARAEGSAEAAANSRSFSSSETRLAGSGSTRATMWRASTANRSSPAASASAEARSKNGRAASGLPLERSTRPNSS